MPDSSMRFQIGVNVIVIRDGSVLLGLRRNCFGAGTWGLPGGHLELGESLVGAAARELKEETGLHADAYRFMGVSNTGLSGGDHYLQTAFLAERLAGEPRLCEPDRCSEWRFIALTSLPDNVFPSHRPLLAAFVSGQTLIDEPQKA
ncbi:NUDIX domain-containing protein [Patescibacteria group bacterium]|nr:MAG: NUDIX domain-containing protein [Patescibacteria group bacterium]